MKLLAFLLCAACFFGLFGLEYFFLLRPSRTLGVTAVAFVVVYILMTKVYGGFDIGKRKSKPIVFSMALTLLLTDLVTHFLLCIMNTTVIHGGRFVYECPLLLLAVYMLQVALVIIMAYGGNDLYFKVNKPQRCLMVARRGECIEDLIKKVGRYKKQYNIQQVAWLDQPDLLTCVDHADAVFLYELSVRERTDALDSLGNTTAATGKGFAIGSASLTALALLVSYVNIVQENTEEMLNFTLTSPTVLVGMFIGAMLTFVFSAFTMSAVQKAAQSIVVEVRRQFKEIAGIMEYKADPDYASCVSLCTKGALHEMVVPALLAIIVPLATGLVLGPTGVVGLLGGVSVTGFAMAVFMSNAGGAWDNAKKYIEEGHHGGKGSDAHKAAVVGDTVGDPFKDTSGPSINILIKLMTVVSTVFAAIFTANGLF